MPHREALAKLAKDRRLALGLSVVGAAERAGVARGTWVAMEAGTRQVSERQWAAIERALSWAPGSVGRVLNGEGAPAEIEAVHATRPSMDLLTEAQRIGNMDLPAEDRLAMVLILIRAHTERDAERARRRGPAPDPYNIVAERREPWAG